MARSAELQAADWLSSINPLEVDCGRSSHLTVQMQADCVGDESEGLDYSFCYNFA